MSVDVVFGVAQDGSYIVVDGSRHHLYMRGKNFDVYVPVNARETIYVLFEYPEDCDMLVRLTSKNFLAMSHEELEKYVSTEVWFIKTKLEHKNDQ